MRGMWMKLAAIVAVAGLVVGLWGGVASAHVVVGPAAAETAAEQIFTIAVPSEREVSTVKLRLLVPAGIGQVTPTAKPGWHIDTASAGARGSGAVTEIVWSGGQVPAGQRDDFSFSAQLPARPVTLQWKAYQTYADGSVVAWDQPPAAGSGDDDSGAAGPYSQTKVVDSLPASTAPPERPASAADTDLAIGLSVLSVILSVVALTRVPNGKPRK